MSIDRERLVYEVLTYFAVFDYPVTSDQLHLFFQQKIPKEELLSIVDDMVKARKILKNEITRKDSLNYYALLPHRIHFAKRTAREKISKSKLGRTALFIRLMGIVPIIKLIGLSGSLAMNNATQEEDIDLFIITEKNRIFTGRLIALFLASALGMRRRRNDKRAPDRLCLNLFFDMHALTVPPNKKNVYIAHEIVQMVPLFMRAGVYKEFITANKWVFEYFPNARAVKMEDRRLKIDGEDRRLIDLSLIGDLVEAILKRIQLFLINRHKTTEIITDHQLWFFPRDFEKELRKKGIVKT